MAKNGMPFEFTKARFAKLFPLTEDEVKAFFDLGETWGKQAGNDASLHVFDGYIQSIYNKNEPICMFFQRDSELYDMLNGMESFEECPVHCLGGYLDVIAREQLNSFFHLMIGRKDPNNGSIYLAAYPMIEGYLMTFKSPVKLIHLIPDPDHDMTGSYSGAWAVVDDDYSKLDNADEIIEHYREDTRVLGNINMETDMNVIMSGSIRLRDSRLSSGAEMTPKHSFEALVYTCKMAAMIALSNTFEADPGEEVDIGGRKRLNDAQRKMEDIFIDCSSKLQTFMLRNPGKFEGMSDPMEEIIGNGMGYTGLMYSSRFSIVILTCWKLELALKICRDALQDFTKTLHLDYDVLPWNSKSQSSIYTKITDYADKKVEPQMLRSCGLLGIKDYVRTRLVVPEGKDARECADDFLAKVIEKYDIQDVICKDKSFRFKPDGQAIYVTGMVYMPIGGMVKSIFQEKFRMSDHAWPFVCCKHEKEKGPAEDFGLFAVPIEIQVVNKAALDFINAAHHSYEIERVCQRIAAVCNCTKDASGEKLPQTQCGHCMYRRSLGFGYCPFCHICFKSGSQEMICKKPCCAGKNDSKASNTSIAETLNGLDEEGLNKVRAMEAELIAWRTIYGSASGSSLEAAKALRHQ